MLFISKIILIYIKLIILALSLSLSHGLSRINICGIYCFFNGICEFFKNDFVCHCNPGFKGDCSQKIEAGENICLSNPCWNGGICKSLYNNTDYKCDCPPGATGRDCKIKYNSEPCAIYNACDFYNPCKNNAKCVTATINGKSKPVCECLSNFTGTLCETYLPCSENVPCKNNGICYKNKCFCAPNWKGMTCETYTDYNAPKIVKVRNIGWYTADMILTFQTFDNDIPSDRALRAQILGQQEYTFLVPYNANYFKGKGARLNIRAIAGALVMDYIIDNDPLCFHIWGGSLTPSWSVMACW